jgi:hypothetical protein
MQPRFLCERGEGSVCRLPAHKTGAHSAGGANLGGLRKSMRSTGINRRSQAGVSTDAAPLGEASWSRSEIGQFPLKPNAFV